MRHFLWLLLLVAFAVPSQAQSLGNAGSIEGKVTDSTGAVVPGAKVTIVNPVSRFSQSTVTDSAGQFQFRNIPYNPYHLSASAAGFQSQQQDVSLRSQVTSMVNFALPVAGGNQVVNVEADASDLIERDTSSHTDVDSKLIARLPSESMSSALSSVITLTTPGVVADSNGLFHPLGEHSETTFSVDGQPVSDQQSRAFSNQLSSNSIQSLEAISGVPPAEFGDKSSLVVRTLTKSGLGLSRPTGNLSAGYGSFGSSTGSASLGLGSQRFGNFVSVDGINSGRFLDTPEFRPLHAKGNSENIFERFDFQLTPQDNIHLNLFAARSWFQIPNQFDQQAAGQDQRQLLRSFNFAPSYNHIFSPSTLMSVSAYLRQDRVNYFPSANRFADSPATLSESRRLTNAGVKVDVSYVKGIHNAKAGVNIYHTFLSENFQTGLTDPTFNSPCLDANLNAVGITSLTNPSQCAAAGFTPNDGSNPNASVTPFGPGLLPFDLTRAGTLFQFRGKSDIKQEAFYVQDVLTLKQLTLTLGLREDNYNGLSNSNLLQPRTGISYLIGKTNTVLRASYGRFQLSPYNENLILSSATGQGGLASNVFGAFGSQPITPARRNQFNAGFQQALGKLFVVDADYFWKYTRGDYDFDVLFNSPLTFPIQWRKSKIDGVSVRLNFPDFHGVNAFTTLGHTRSRFFGPEVGGILFNSPVTQKVFRIDHDQALQQTTNVQYQFPRKGPWVGITWRYDSGLVAGRVPDFATALRLTPDQQSQIGLFCGNTFATPSAGITGCSSPNLGVTRVVFPVGTPSDDRNPPRIASRNLFDLGMGLDNILRADRYKTNLTFTVTNLTNKDTLYNVLSTFSGTHFVSPRAFQGQLTFNF